MSTSKEPEKKPAEWNAAVPQDKKAPKDGKAPRDANAKPDPAAQPDPNCKPDPNLPNALNEGPDPHRNKNGRGKSRPA